MLLTNNRFEYMMREKMIKFYKGVIHKGRPGKRGREESTENGHFWTGGGEGSDAPGRPDVLHNFFVIL